MDNKTKGIIFDMDNTLLRSRIDFESMKKETYRFLVDHKVLPENFDLANHTSSTIITEAMGTNLLTANLTLRMWEIPTQFEMLGMQGAKLEQGVVELLTELQNKYLMTVVTNNSIDAANSALAENNIIDFFDCIVGREQMGQLKPSPDGILYVLDQFKHISTNEWISVGDAWVDGKASIDAGVRFIAYQGNIEKMNRMGIFPDAHIQDIRELIRYI